MTRDRVIEYFMNDSLHIGFFENGLNCVVSIAGHTTYLVPKVRPISLNHFR
jgi:hypothetical protein